MRKEWQKPLQFRTGQSTGIWLATLLALGLHAVFLLLPIARQMPSVENSRNFIELQLTTLTEAEPGSLLPEPPQDPLDQPVTQATPEPPLSTPPEQTEIRAQEIEPVPLTPLQAARKNKPDLDEMNEPEKARLTDTILARQYISEESAVDQLFGKPVVDNNEFREEFHLPTRPSLITMLDQPMPEVPFAYTPGLVYFAYDPGVKGELQRFWDVITPEFGWRTRYGTEVKCIMILVIIGCGWK
jgi:hypothetical protein